MNTYNTAILHCKMRKHYQMVPGSLVTANIVTICRPNEFYRQKTSQFCDGIDIKATIYKQKYEADGINFNRSCVFSFASRRKKSYILLIVHYLSL